MTPTPLYHAYTYWPDVRAGDPLAFECQLFDGWADLVEHLGSLNDDGRTFRVLRIEQDGAKFLATDMTEDAGRAVAASFPADLTEAFPLVHPLARPFDPCGADSGSFPWEKRAATARAAA